MIVEARKRSEGLALPVEFRVGNVAHLDLPDNSFDGCRAERVFVHLEDPRHALTEIVRVAKPGAWIVSVDIDHDSHIIDALNHEVTRKIVHFRSDQLRNRHGARQLYRLFQDVGLQEVAVAAEARVRTDFATFDIAWRPLTRLAGSLP
jgi:ubiquinone/menaquinone biosynthesis C-methylase UbiE